MGKFGIIFETRPCEINDLAVSSRQPCRPKMGRGWRSKVEYIVNCGIDCFEGREPPNRDACPIVKKKKRSDQW